jgi:hypothetical protein
MTNLWLDHFTLDHLVTTMSNPLVSTPPPHLFTLPQNTEGQHSSLPPVTIPGSTKEEILSIVTSNDPDSADASRLVEYILARSSSQQEAKIESVRQSLKKHGGPHSHALALCGLVHQRVLDACAKRIREHCGQGPHIMDEEHKTAMRELGHFVSCDHS